MSKKLGSDAVDFEALIEDGTADFLNHIGVGDFGDAIKIIKELSEIRHDSFYKEVENLTRSFHNAIHGFQVDSGEDSELSNTKIAESIERVKKRLESFNSKKFVFTRIS